ncbi:MAG: LURP-one-related/scramblase family protein [Dehalococcoidia bacterium]
MSIGDDFHIEKRGRRVFHVDGKALRFRETLVFADMQGNELCSIKEKMLRVRDSMEVERNGQVVAKVHKALISLLRDRFEVDLGKDHLAIQGNIVNHEYTFEQNGRKVAEVSKKWLRIADSYGVEIAPGQDDIIILACTVCLDQMAHG